MFNDFQADHSGRAVYGKNRLRSLERWVVGSNPNQGMVIRVCVVLSCV
jgi:hypothetical protein